MLDFMPFDSSSSTAARRADLLVLGALTAVAPLATDMYVPGLPEMRSEFGVGDGAAQFTLAVFLIGAVLGQLFFGPLSDRVGRRGLLIGGTVAFAIASVGCAIAPSVGMFVALRFLQGVSGSIGIVLARAITADRFTGAELVRSFAVLSQILGVAPVIAPVIGGAIADAAGWRAVFSALAVVGAVLVVAVALGVSESLPREARVDGEFKIVFTRMGMLARDREFAPLILAMGSLGAMLFAYISSSSFVFQDVHGFSAVEYSLLFAVNAIGMLIGGGLYRRLGIRGVSSLSLMRYALGATFVACWMLVAAVVALNDPLILTVVLLFIIVTALGVGLPATMTAGQERGIAAPGAASALLGAGQYTLGAIASPLPGSFGAAGALPMAVVMGVAAILGLIAVVTTRRRSARS